MTFDPFGDFEARGYLRNVAKAEDPAIAQRLQHNSFLTGINAAPGMAIERVGGHDDPSRA